ncbi:MAG: Mth938-like domain-containing protein [Candidatus Puniceispirillaceae bacterium]
MKLVQALMSESQLPKGTSSIVDIKELEGDGKLTIVHSYGNQGFRIAKQGYSGSQILLPRQRFDWHPPHWQDISLEDLSPIFVEPLPPLLIMGLGAAPQGLLPELQVALHEKGISLEIMSTPAACRTWNVLLSEGRHAAVALLAID